MLSRGVAIAGAAVLLGACVSPPLAEENEWADKLQSPKEEERTEAFQWLLRRGSEAMPAIKRVLPQGSRAGHAAAALLYALGEGDAVSLEIRARHLAAFRWPRAHDAENAVVEAYAWREVERDLVRDGRPAVRALAAALERDAPTEAKALQAVRVLLRLGRREVADAFAGLLGTERDLGGLRVCDVAAGALLHFGRQEAALRIAAPGRRLAEAREWWEQAKDQPESEWCRGAVKALASRARPKDPEDVRGLLELLTGESIEDPAAWAERNPDWKPTPSPVRPESLLGSLAGPGSFRANLLLEQATGTRVWLPRLETLADLLSANRLWRAPRDLDVRWRRALAGTLLRLSISAVGHHPKKGSNGVLWSRDSYFHASEEGSEEIRVGKTETYSLYVQVCDLGTRFVVNEFLGRLEAGLASVEEVDALRPFAVFSPLLQACVVVEVSEVPARRAPRGPEEVVQDLRRLLRAAAQGAPEGVDRAKLLRALGYFQEPEDREFLRERKAGEALLLQGDPASLEWKPRLSAVEIEMALRKAVDPAVKAYLEGLKP